MKRTSVLLAIGCLAIAAVALTSAGLALPNRPGRHQGQDRRQMPRFHPHGRRWKEYKLSETLKKGPAVLIFSSQECPYSRKADPILSALYTACKDQGVAF